MKNIGLSLGLISITIALGGCFNAYFSPYLAKKGGTNLTFLVTALICLLAACLNSSLKEMDKQVMKEIK